MATWLPHLKSGGQQKDVAHPTWLNYKDCISEGIKTGHHLDPILSYKQSL
jgi:hypothetical protein